MQYKAHATAGITTGLLIAPFAKEAFNESSSGPMLVAVVVGASIVGSLMPDIDHRGSYMGKKMPILSFLFSKSLGHRGATHAPLLLLLMSILLAGVTTSLLPFSDDIKMIIIVGITGLCFGSLSHVLLDSLTPSGVPALYPLSKKKFRIAQFKTGGMVEHGLTVLLMALNIWLAIQLFI